MECCLFFFFFKRSIHTGHNFLLLITLTYQFRHGVKVVPCSGTRCLQYSAPPVSPVSPVPPVPNPVPVSSKPVPLIHPGRPVYPMLNHYREKHILQKVDTKHLTEVLYQIFMMLSTIPSL